MIPLCIDQSVGLMPWSPLARGLLARGNDSGTVRNKTDEYARYRHGVALTEADQKIMDAVQKIAAARGVPPAQVAMAWFSHKPAMVAPIVGASKVHHIEDAVAALSIKLTVEEVAALEAPYVAQRIIGHQ